MAVLVSDEGAQEAIKGVVLARLLMTRAWKLSRLTAAKTASAISVSELLSLQKAPSSLLVSES